MQDLMKHLFKTVEQRSKSIYKKAFNILLNLTLFKI